MMNDRDLLERAARAIGGTLSEGHTKRRTGETWADWEWIGGLGINMPNGTVAYPHLNDGHALHFAVILNIGIQCHTRDGHGYAMARCGRGDHEPVVIAIEPGIDPHQATRSAILGAAALMEA